MPAGGHPRPPDKHPANSTRTTSLHHIRCARITLAVAGAVRKRSLCHPQGYSHGGPIRCRKRGYILTTDQSDAGSA
eukprot:211986-Prorocentrum_minimum.AAC.1